MEEKHEKKFDGVFLRRWLWDYKGTNEKIGWTEKIVFSMIDLLDNERQGCFASNDYLAKNMDVSKDRISKIITKLNRDGLINVQLIRNEKNEVEKRIIKVNLNRVIELEYPDTYRQTQLDPIGKDAYTLSVNTPTINSTLNNNINIKESKKKTSSKKNPFDSQRKEIIEYLNKVTGKSIDYNELSAKQAIDPKLKSGETVETFKSIIDFKWNDWSNSAYRDKNMIPKTLFRNNFSQYKDEMLNAKKPKQPYQQQRQPVAAHHAPIKKIGNPIDLYNTGE